MKKNMFEILQKMKEVNKYKEKLLTVESNNVNISYKVNIDDIYILKNNFNQTIVIIENYRDCIYIKINVEKLRYRKGYIQINDNIEIS